MSRASKPPPGRNRRPGSGSMGLLLLLLGLVAAAAVILTLLPAGRPPAGQHGVARHAPPPLPGTPLQLKLTEPRADQYGPQDNRPDDAERADAVRAAGGVWDPALAHAARALARHYAHTRGLLPGDALQFLLDAAGATVWGARQTVLITDVAAADARREALSDPIDPQGFLAGLGELPLEGGGLVVAMVSATPTVTLDPVDVSPDSDRPLRITGRLSPAYENVRALAMTPDHRIVEVPVTQNGARFEANLTPEAGTWLVELIADGAFGPTPLSQLSLWVGQRPPRAFNGAWPITDEDDPVGAAVARVQATRRAHDLPELIVDATLTGVAEAHNADMHDHHFLGHRSPRTGGPTDRVRSAGFRAVQVAENVAFNRSLADAHEGLMRSLGHRRNLVSAEVTHLGLAATQGAEGWYLTQLFARPRPIVNDPEAAALQLLARLGKAATHAPRSPVLDRIARAEARNAHPEPRRALDAVAAAGTTGRVVAWVATLGALEQFEPPTALEGRTPTAVGIGVHQDPQIDGPDIQVVLLLIDGGGEP